MTNILSSINKCEFSDIYRKYVQDVVGGSNGNAWAGRWDGRGK